MIPTTNVRLYFLKILGTTTLPTTLLKAMIYQFSLIVIVISRVVAGLTTIENRTTDPRIQTSEGIFLKRGTGNGEGARERK